VAAAKILAVKADTCIDQLTCPVSLPALSACLPCQSACLVSLPAFVSLSALIVHTDSILVFLMWIFFAN
jgi:hypothetical protein